MTVIQRFGSGLQLNVHSHALFLDGVFTEAADGTLRFHPAPPPTDLEVARLVATIRTRVLRLLRRRGVFVDAADDDAPDPLAETSLALAGITSAAVQGRSALGPRAGARVLQLGRVPGAPWVTTTGTPPGPPRRLRSPRQRRRRGEQPRRAGTARALRAAAADRAGAAEPHRRRPRAPDLEGRVERRHHRTSCSNRSSCWNGWRRSRRARASTSSCTMVCWHRTVGGAPGRSPTGGTPSPPSVPTLRSRCGSAAPPVPSSAPPSDGGLEASGAAHRDPVVAVRRTRERTAVALRRWRVATRAPSRAWRRPRRPRRGSGRGRS